MLYLSSAKASIRRGSDQRGIRSFPDLFRIKFAWDTVKPLRKWVPAKNCERPTPKAPDLREFINMILNYPKIYNFRHVKLGCVIIALLIYIIYNIYYIPYEKENN